MKRIPVFTMGLAIVFMLATSGTAPAFKGAGGPGTGNFIEDFDKDGDGLVSQEEFPGPDDHFTQFDADGDGYLDEDEAPQGPPPGHMGGGQGPNPMDRMDTDGDGLVSLDEFPGPDNHFTQFDADGDGFLSGDELPKGPPPMKNAGQGHGTVQ